MKQTKLSVLVLSTSRAMSGIGPALLSGDCMQPLAINKMGGKLLLSFALGTLIGVLLAYYGGRLGVDRTDDTGGVYKKEENKKINYHIMGKGIQVHRNTRKIREKVKILCWVMTQPSSHHTKAQFSRMTWARQCNELIYISEGLANDSLPVHKVKASSSREGLWDKAKEAFKLIHKDFQGKYDWVLKADDDSFVHLDSLRKLLVAFNSSQPLYMGEAWKQRWDYRFHLPQGYMVGGGGYVLSKEAVKRFVGQLFDKRSDKETGCIREIKSSEEDPLIGECLDEVGVETIDTRDLSGLATFNQYNIDSKMMSHRHPDSWWWMVQFYNSTTINDNICCSNTLISSHYVSPYEMFAFQYLIDRVNPFDLGPTTQVKNEAENP